MFSGLKRMMITIGILVISLIIATGIYASIKRVGITMTVTCANGSCTVTCTNGLIPIGWCDTAGAPHCNCGHITISYISSMDDFLGNNAISFAGSMAPQTINLKRQGRFYTFYIEDPLNTIDLSSIDLSTVKLFNTFNRVGPTEIGDEDGDGIPDLMVKFDADEVDLKGNISRDGLTLPLTLTFIVTGYLNDRTAFFAMGDADVICPPDNCQ